MNIEYVFELVNDELKDACKKFESFNSFAEGYAVILEEVEEMWTEIKDDKTSGRKVRVAREAIQVAAMALRMLNLCDKTLDLGDVEEKLNEYNKTYNSFHEAYAIILKKLDNLWLAVKNPSYWYTHWVKEIGDETVDLAILTMKLLDELCLNKNGDPK